jgi:hypothetical protein
MVGVENINFFHRAQESPLTESLGRNVTLSQTVKNKLQTKDSKESMQNAESLQTLREPIPAITKTRGKMDEAEWR